MDMSFLLRIVLGLIIAAALFFQSRKLVNQPHRKRAFQLGAVALLCFAAFNFMVSQGAELGALQQAAALAGMVLFVIAAVSLVISLISGERRTDAQRIATAQRSFREEREQATRERKP